LEKKGFSIPENYIFPFKRCTNNTKCTQTLEFYSNELNILLLKANAFQKKIIVLITCQIHIKMYIKRLLSKPDSIK